MREQALEMASMKREYEKRISSLSELTYKLKSENKLLVKNQLSAHTNHYDSVNSVIETKFKVPQTKILKSKLQTQRDNNDYQGSTQKTTLNKSASIPCLT